MSGTRNPQDAQIAASIGLALNLLNAGQWAAAEVHLARVLSARPLEPDALQLLGLVRAMQNRPAEAEALYRRSLAARPAQAHVQMNLGNVLLTLGRPVEAIEAYRAAVRLKPDYGEAHANLAGALHNQGDLEGAERSYRLALKHQPQSVKAPLGLSGVLNDLGRPVESEAVLRQALVKKPSDPRDNAALEHNLGVALKLQRRHEEALAHYDRARAMTPQESTIDYNRGNVLMSMGRSEEAEAAYKSALAKNPLNLAAHHDLNGLYYSQKRDAEFLRSYDEALQKAPRALPLLLQKGGFLLKCDRFAEAQDIFARAALIEPKSAGAQNGLAFAFTKLGAFDRAIEAYERSLGLAPHDVTTKTNLASTYLQAGESRSALPFAEAALAQTPLDQNTLAVMELVLRANDDPRAQLLNDYETFLQIFDLDPPEGFSDMESFNAELNRYLDGLHTNKREFVDQTLRGGTQTFERIFDAGHDLVERLRKRIEEAIATYIARMAASETHPFLSRRRDGFAFSGSWSSRLHDCGYHTNHIHPKGWISSCYYVAVPDVAAEPLAKQGWFKVGEPSFDAHLKEPVRRSVEPKPGRLVLFPSYTWHGTNPFHSQQSRTTIAFDAIPR